MPGLQQPTRLTSVARVRAALDAYDRAKDSAYDLVDWDGIAVPRWIKDSLETGVVTLPAPRKRKRFTL